jgi:hypothetical protein
MKSFSWECSKWPSCTFSSWYLSLWYMYGEVCWRALCSIEPTHFVQLEAKWHHGIAPTIFPKSTIFFCRTFESDLDLGLIIPVSIMSKIGGPLWSFRGKDYLHFDFFNFCILNPYFETQNSKFIDTQLPIGRSDSQSNNLYHMWSWKCPKQDLERLSFPNQVKSQPMSSHSHMFSWSYFEITPSLRLSSSIVCCSKNCSLSMF